MINLRENPFYLNDSQISWVEKMIAGMNVEDKIRQLFILLDTRQNKDENSIRSTIQETRQGGLRWQGGNWEAVYNQNTAYQKYSPIPLLIAANCDDGGSGAFPEGTFVATAVQAAAEDGEETAYHMGLVAAKESGSAGCNWLFNPVADIYMNWRNSIVNTRCFGDTADTVLKNTRAFIKGVRAGVPHMACCAKHFPGDGVEELDQHLVMGINSLDVDEWEASFGKVYRGLISDGIESIMVGHIAFPAMSRKLVPGIKDSEIMPATVSPELLTDLLRNKLGFQGLILTDATHMIGLSAVIKREDALPRAIAAGCDMILFANNLEEDLGFIRNGLIKGIISEKRLDDAVTRILALKARVRVNEPDICFPDAALGKSIVGCTQHLSYTEAAAEKCITLVKDTNELLPVNPEKYKKALLVYVPNIPNSRAYSGDPVKNIVIEELQNAGFEVDALMNFHDLEIKNGPGPMNFGQMLEPGSRKEFRSKYDLVFLVLNIKGYAQENNERIRWSIHHSKEMPWYIPEVPTIAMSLNYTNHLIDIPQVKTLVHVYSSQRIGIRKAIEKICGKTEFRGRASETVFCGRWETRL